MARFSRLFALILIAIAVLWLSATPAAAHTQFEASEPGDGDVMDRPLTEVRLVFTSEASPVGDGFQILAPDGQLRSATDVSSPDGRSWVLRFDPPIVGGAVGVRWTVQAPDAHPISGSFTFTVSASAPWYPAPDVPVDGGNELATFLASDESSLAHGEQIAMLGRILSVAGMVVGIGGLVFASLVLRDSSGDVRYVMFWVRRAGALIVVGTIVEVVGQFVITGGRWSALWLPSVAVPLLLSPYGVAVALRILGGAMLTAGAQLDSPRTAMTWDRVGALAELVGVGAPSAPSRSSVSSAETRRGVPRSPIAEMSSRPGEDAWLSTSDSAAAVVGVIPLAVSYLFDGHTVTSGNRYVTALVDLAHVFGGAVWAGGVLMLVGVLWRRHHRGQDLLALPLALRFSVVATVALPVVALAGAVLTLTVLDNPAELWSTPWGRILIAKMVVVALAVAAGGYNHTVLIPQMETVPEELTLETRFRVIVSLEAAAMVLVVIATAALVGAGS